MAGAGAAALLRCVPSPSSSSPPATTNFPLSVAAGDPTPTGAVLWTKVFDDQPVHVRVWEETGGSSALLAETDAPPSLEGFVHVEVDGLQPNRWHAYTFTLADGSVSPVGRFKTLPVAEALPLVRLGATCCTRYGMPFDTLARAAERTDLDAFLLLGDTVYADGANTLTDYREKWHQTLSTAEYRALKASTAIIATWDDHEFNNDWSGDSISPDRFKAASTAFFEHLPVRRQSSAMDRVWRSVRFGRTAEVFVLDSRSERVHSQGQYLGPEQMAWLKDGLLNSPARFKLIMNSVPISSFDVPFFQPFARDRWEGFPNARREILEHVESSGATGVLWLSGDFHLAALGKVSLDGAGTRAHEVLVGPGGQTANASASYPSAPQFQFSSGINNYTTLELDPLTGQVRLAWVDGTGRTFKDTTLSL